MDPLDRRAYAVMTAAWALVVLLVNPTGNFPLIDDWSYAWAVRSLVVDGEWRLHDWTSMPLGTQLVWGALFSTLFGFSFTTLRASTLVLAWLATAGVYALMRRCGAGRQTALLLAAAFAVCPIFFSLSFTFMTDVPAAAFAIWALVFAVRYLQTCRRLDLIACVVLLTATILIRQTGAALAAGCAAAFLFVRPGRKGLIAAALTFAVPVSALALHNAMVEAVKLPALYGGHQQEVLRTLTTAPLQAANRVRILGAVFYLYFGLLLLPVVWLMRRPTSARARAMAMLVLAASVVYLPVRGRMLPILGGSLYDVAVYPLTMPRNDLWPHAARSIRFALTVAALAASVLVGFAVLRACQALWRDERMPAHVRATIVLGSVATLGYLLPFTQVHAFDRYLVVPAVLVMMLMTAAGAISGRASRPAVAASLATLFVFAAFDIAATRDYFAFSRARQMAMNTILDEGVPAREIRGGLEVSGWLGALHGADVEEIRRWSYFDPPVSAVISLGPLSGFAVRRSYEFPRLIGNRPGIVYDLRRPAR